MRDADMKLGRWNEVGNRMEIIRRDERTVLPPWLDPLSLAAGIGIGAVGWAWAVPSLGTLLAGTSVASFVASAGIGMTGLVVAWSSPSRTRTPFAGFRQPPGGSDAAARDAARRTFLDGVHASGPAEWIRAHAPGTDGKGPDVRRYVIANALSDQLTLRDTPLVGALIDALLAVHSGQAGVDILDDLAKIAAQADRVGPAKDPATPRGSDERVPEGLDTFRERVSGIIHKRRALADSHAFVETKLLGALAMARSQWIVPTADFAWLSRHHGPLWAAACSLGSTGTIPDALGILAHYHAERSATHRLDTPEVTAAVEALLAAEAGDAGRAETGDEESDAWVPDTFQDEGA